jgi:hypothetical protein
LKINKKSQITAFIIIGLIILFSTVLIFYVKYKIDNKRLIPEIDEIKPEFADVQKYILNCVELLGEEALIKVGEHGGYIDLFSTEYSNKVFNLHPLPYDSDVVYMNKQYPIPYWWHLKTPNNCLNCLVSDENVPTIIEIQDQVNNYVKNNLKECLGDYKTLKKKGYNIEEKGKIEPRTIISKDNVDVYIKYPLKITFNNKETTIENFPTSVELDFEEFFNFANSINQGVKNLQFFETMLMHIVSSYSDLNSNSLPPISASDESFTPIVWSKTAVKYNLKQLIQSHVPFTQIENTKNYEQIITQDELETSMLKLFTIYNNQSYENLEVNFINLDWPIYFDITPNDGSLLKPLSHRTEPPLGILKPTQKNLYHFYYDVSFPVVIEIRDENALNGKGFSFLFAVEATVMDNLNLALWHSGEGTIGPWDQSLVTASLNFKNKKPPVLKKYDETTKTYYNKTYSTPEKKLFCEKNQRISGDITVQVLNEKTKIPVKNVDISFGCGDYSTCSIGSTDEEGEYIGKFPICVGGGFITLNKKGHAPYAKSSLTILPDKTQNFIFNFKKLKKIIVEPRFISTNKIYTLTADGKKQDKTISKSQIQSIKGSATNFIETDEAIISFTKIKEDPFEPNFVRFINFQGENPSGKIELIEGKYKIQGTYLDTTGVIIPKHTKKISDDGSLAYIDEIILDPAPIGGVSINENTGLWTVKESDFNNSKIIIYYFKSTKPKIADELEYALDFTYPSKTFRDLIEPDFVE